MCVCVCKLYSTVELLYGQAMKQKPTMYISAWARTTHGHKDIVNVSIPTCCAITVIKHMAS